MSLDSAPGPRLSLQDIQKSIIEVCTSKGVTSGGRCFASNVKSINLTHSYTNQKKVRYVDLKLVDDRCCDV